MQLDIGFGDIVTPGPVELELPTLLDFPAPRVLAYTPETTIAEKLDAIIRHDELNSRIKDFCDIWLLLTTKEFQGRILSDAIRSTFQQRNTPFNASSIGLQPAFAELPDKRNLWRKHIRQTRLTNVLPDNLADAIKDIAGFLKPILKSLSMDEAFDLFWTPAQRWQ